VGARAGSGGRRHGTGVVGDVRVVRIDPDGRRVLEVALTVELDGAEPYPALVTGPVPPRALASARPGAWVRVSVGDRPDDVVVDWALLAF